MFGLSPISAFAITLFLGLVLLAAVIDLSQFRIPNRLSLAVAALYPVHVASVGTDADWPAALGVALLVFTAGAAMFAAGLMGGGDVKLMSAIALWAGPTHILPFLVVTTVAGGTLALAMATSARFVAARLFEASGLPEARDALFGRKLPYAVAIACGTCGAVAPALLTASP